MWKLGVRNVTTLGFFLFAICELVESLNANNDKRNAREGYSPFDPKDEHRALQGANLGYSRMAYFGDSITDSGNLFPAVVAATGVGYPPSPPYAQRFSNGLVYSMIVPDLLGVEGGDDLNYAYGFAETSTGPQPLGPALELGGIIPFGTTAASNSTELLLRIDLLAQVERFLETFMSDDLSNMAATIFIGLNDFAFGRRILQVVATLNTTEQIVSFLNEVGGVVANATIQTTQLLVDAGVGTIIFGLLPSSSTRASMSDDPATLALLPFVEIPSTVHNNVLRAYGDSIASTLSNGVRYVDFDLIINHVDLDFQNFGFRQINTPAYIFPISIINPEFVANPAPLDQIAQFDNAHPTEAYHGIFAAFAAASLTSSLTELTTSNPFVDFVPVGTFSNDLVMVETTCGRCIVSLFGGDDTFLGGIGNEVVVAGFGDDTVLGGSGNDWLFGNAGADLLAPGSGNDITYGGWGNDIIILGSGTGSDWAVGGLGNDLFVFTQEELYGRVTNTGASPKRIFGGLGFDTLVLRVEDPSSVDIFDLGLFFTSIGSLGVTAYGINSVIVVNGTDPLDSLQASYPKLKDANLWNLIDV